MRIPPKQPKIEETDEGLRRHITTETGDAEAFDRMVRAITKEYPNTIVAKETGVHPNTSRKYTKIYKRIHNADK
jgi:hypothetical protein